MQDLVPWTLYEDFESSFKENKKNVCFNKLQEI